jgi:hypothetical protein
MLIEFINIKKRERDVLPYGRAERFNRLSVFCLPGGCLLAGLVL